jgi:uncharacterized protein YybS (DUF2232 family)
MLAADEFRIGPDTIASRVAAFSLSFISRFLFGSRQIGVTGIIYFTFNTVLSLSLFFIHPGLFFYQFKAQKTFISFLNRF